MVVPRLIHKVRTTIEPIDRASTPWDEDAREAIQNVSRLAPIEVVTQPEYRKNPQGIPGMEMPRITPGGVIQEQVAYLLLRRVDALKKSYDPLPGDRIAKIGHMDVDLYVKWLQPIAHYAGGWTLIRLYVIDREPMSHTRGSFG